MLRLYSKLNAIQKSLFFAALSLIFVNLACQTISEDSREISKEEELLETKLSLAQTQLDLSEAAQAFHTLKPLVAEYPKEPRVLTLMGLAQLAIGHTPKAMEYLKRACEIAPSGYSYLNLSSAQISAGHYQEARSILQKALDFKDYASFERVFHNIGVTYEKEKDYKNAVRFYQKALYEHPTYYQSTYRIGLLYEKLGKTDKAIEHLKKAVSFCVVCIEPLKDLTQLYLKNKKPADAMKYLTTYLKQKDVPVSDQQEAKNLLRQVLAAVPSNRSFPHR